MCFTGYLMSGTQEIARIDRGNVIPLKPALLPLYLASDGDFARWIESRAIDRHRPNSRILKKLLRLTDSSDFATVLRAHAATITDNYWVKREDEQNLTYDQIRFSEDTFAELALTGSFHSYNREYTKAQLGGQTPELTNIGSYEKCWKIFDGAWWLYKRGTALERYSELFIAALGQRMGFNMAEYYPEAETVKSRDFTKGVYNYEPASSIVGDNEDYVYNFDRIRALDEKLIPQYLDILFMDALCFNMDRHTQNYGFLRDRETGEVLAMAPNFDNNIALISHGYGDDPTKTNGLLIQLFVDLLEEKELYYRVPTLDAEVITEIANSILPEEEIDRSYVATMITERLERLENKLNQLPHLTQFFSQHMM